jgi:hypothetical protein
MSSTLNLPLKLTNSNTRGVILKHQIYKLTLLQGSNALNLLTKVHYEEHFHAYSGLSYDISTCISDYENL